MIQNLINKIQKTNLHKLPQRQIQIDHQTYSQIYNIPQTPLPDIFKLELEKVGGQVFICKSELELINNLKNIFYKNSWKKPVTFSPFIKQILQKADIKYFDTQTDFNDLDVGINECEALAAWTGSVIVSSFLPGARQFNVYSPSLIIIARYNQLFLELQQAIDYVINKYPQPPSAISVITGPSKTADIEKTLIYGMHGAKQLIVLIY